MMKDIGEYDVHLEEIENSMMMMALVAQPELLRQILEEQGPDSVIEGIRGRIMRGNNRTGMEFGNGWGVRYKEKLVVPSKVLES
ncbi:hypothetical protein Dimus_022861, partial [Dionaea muscipula]